MDDITFTKNPCPKSETKKAPPKNARGKILFNENYVVSTFI